ncbi:hypothetical protein KX928_23370 [Roseobacter sp. YSTF-M11]|uniref:Tail fiber protein n=1 Tax=Roseobacter insulae TaxID=2859783 RepID=A0A9X1G027_9RHOB|nr:hypothetical protein [Roseobacter insulae]MBW4710741.1 hypothetical protein [Roseobacter insulae]
MTTEAFTPTPIRIIAGTGPYSVDHPYQEGGLIVRVLGTSTITVLDPADYTVNPVSSDITGDVTLSVGAATTYAGDDLQILRKTNPEQGWQGQGGAREKSLEAQLDIVTQAIQDTEAELDRTFKVASGVIGDLPGDRAGKALIFDVDGSPIPGPDADAITDAQANATLAAQAAQDAADAAALAATFDPANFQPVDGSLTALSGAPVGAKGLELLATTGGTQIRAIAGIVNGQLCGVGEVSLHLRGVVPAGKMELNGAPFPYDDFPELGAYMGYNPGDSVPIPDVRGYGLRFWDNGRGIDIGRVIGSLQASQVGNHLHPVAGQIADGNGTFNGGYSDLGFAPDGPAYYSGNTTNNPTGGGAENIMLNAAFMACVQFEA